MSFGHLILTSFNPIFFKTLTIESVIHAFKTNDFIIDCGTLKRLKNAQSKYKSVI